MKHIIKKLWIVICLALIINIPILVLGLVRTDKSVLLKGDITNVNSIVDIETDYVKEGSFSSIYVISFDRSTILQNFFVDKSNTSVVEDMNDSYAHISDLENYEIGQIQKESSLMTALITAYEYARKDYDNINIDYSFKSLCVTYYFKDSEFKIGDEILAINDVTYTSGHDALEKALKNSTSGDVVKVLRNDKEVNITLTGNAYKTMCRWYPYYNINYDTISPKANKKMSNVGGPSGGLLQTLSIYNRLIPEDISRGLKIAGTGTMSLDGTVGPIGGIQQKIFTAFDDDVEVFLCPEVHYEEALEAYNKIKYKEKMTLVKVKTLSDAIEYLNNV